MVSELSGVVFECTLSLSICGFCIVKLPNRAKHSAEFFGRTSAFAELHIGQSLLVISIGCVMTW